MRWKNIMEENMVLVEVACQNYKVLVEEKVGKDGASGPRKDMTLETLEGR